MAIELVKWVGILTLVLILVLVNQAGWIVDLGDRSQRGRIANNNELENQLASHPGEEGNHWSVFDVDFRTQPDPTDKNLTPANRFWDNAEPFSEQDHEEANWKTKAFTTTWIGWGDEPDEGIPYCMEAMHSDRLTDFFDSRPGSWSTRNDDALDRKSARMQRDYEIAAIMTATLRSTLAHMKLGRPISEVHRPSRVSRDVAPDAGYCDADSAAHDPRYGVRGMLAYRSTLLGIKLAHAPVVRFRYVAVNPQSAYTDMKRTQNGGQVWGMCLPNDCYEGLGRGTTLYADLFASDAPLMDTQMEAENAIIAMTTEAFWEQAAQENGITDMATVAQARKMAVNALNREFSSLMGFTNII